jgi:hypothetical protein
MYFMKGLASLIWALIGGNFNSKQTQIKQRLTFKDNKQTETHYMEKKQFDLEEGDAPNMEMKRAWLT